MVSTLPQTPGFTLHSHGTSGGKESNRKATTEGRIKGTTFTPSVNKSAFVRACLAQDYPEYSARYDKAVGDAMTLSKTALQRAYPAEYNSLKNRMEKAKAKRLPFADSLKDIRCWLIHLGPRPAEGYTVDRINFTNTKGYVPNNLRWATKTVQTQNRGVTKWHSLPEGPPLTTKQLANKLGLPYLKLYKRLQSGWSIARLLQQDEQPRKIEDWQFPDELTLYCEERYYQNRKHFNTSRLEWFIDHLDSIVYGEKRGNELSLEGLALPSLTKHLVQARQDRQNIIQAMKNYEESKLKELIAIYEPTDQAISQPVPANDTTPQQPLPVAAQARHQPKPRPLPDVEQPYRPSPAEVGEMMTKLAELAARPVMAQ